MLSAEWRGISEAASHQSSNLYMGFPHSLHLDGRGCIWSGGMVEGTLIQALNEVYQRDVCPAVPPSTYIHLDLYTLDLNICSVCQTTLLQFEFITDCCC